MKYSTATHRYRYPAPAWICLPSDLFNLYLSSTLYGNLKDDTKDKSMSVVHQLTREATSLTTSTPKKKNTKKKMTN